MLLLLLALTLQSSGEDEVAATIAGEEILLSDVERAAAEELARVELEYRKNRKALLEASLERLVEEKLLAREAAKTGKSVATLLAEAVPAEPAVTDAEVDGWYEANQGRLQGRAKEAIAPQIRQYLQEQARSEARKRFFDRLSEENEVALLLEPFRVELETEGHPSLGPATAPVTLVEFSDFECPYCNQFNETVQELRAAYPEKVRIVFRQFPLSIHPNAQKAAEASLCAADQERFWEMHDLMFAEPKALAVSDLKEKASRLGLDEGRFAECLDSGRHRERVERDVRAGAAVGVTGTPATFVNGRPLDGGAVPIEELKLAVERALEGR